MKKTLKDVFLNILFCSLFLTSCGAKENKELDDTPNTSTELISDSVSPFMRCYISDKLLSFGFDNFIEKLENDAAATGQYCFYHDDYKCGKQTVLLSGVGTENGEDGKNVLIIDIGKFTQLSMRYSSRIMAHFKFNRKESEYERYDKKILVDPIFYNMFKQIDELDYHVPTAASQCVFNMITKSSGVTYEFEDLSDTDMIEDGHGETSLGIIANYTPKAKFVLAQLFNSNTLCSLDEVNESRWTDETIVSFKKITASLKNIIDQYNINFVNFSAGNSLKSSYDAFDYYCKNRSRPSKRKMRHFLKLINDYVYRPLASYKEVLFVQAAAKSYYKVESSSKDFLVDCSDFSNRIRISDYNGGRKEIAVPLSGGFQVYDIESSRRNMFSCIDMYINSGLTGANDFKNLNNTYKVTGDGMNEYFMLPVSSSFITPVALSYFIYLKDQFRGQHQRWPSVMELKNMTLGSNKGKLFDPIVHEQFELCVYDQIYCDFKKLFIENSRDDKILIE